MAEKSLPLDRELMAEKSLPLGRPPAGLAVVGLLAVGAAGGGALTLMAAKSFPLGRELMAAKSLPLGRPAAAAALLAEVGDACGCCC